MSYFNEMLSNFDLTATFSKAIYINYSSHMIKSTNQILGHNVVSCIFCLLFLWEHSFNLNFTLFLSYLFFCLDKLSTQSEICSGKQAKWSEIVWLLCPPRWFNRWKFLHHDEAKDIVFCHTCLLGSKQKQVRATNGDPAFVSFINYSL